MAIDRSYNGTAQFYNHYSSRMLNDVNGIIADARRGMKGVKYDTLVGRGTSGMLIIPVVARALRKNYFIVRKPEESNSAHSGIGFLGRLGRRWIFFDDFVSSGETFYQVRRGVSDAIVAINRNPREIWDNKRGRYVKVDEPLFETKLVGLFEYCSRELGCDTGRYAPYDERLRLRDWSEKWCNDMPGDYLEWEQRRDRLAEENN